MPEDLYSSRAVPFAKPIGFLDRELPCECPSCSEIVLDAYGR
jgi:hypothetical protein